MLGVSGTVSIQKVGTVESLPTYNDSQGFSTIETLNKRLGQIETLIVLRIAHFSGVLLTVGTLVTALVCKRNKHTAIL